MWRKRNTWHNLFLGLWQIVDHVEREIYLLLYALFACQNFEFQFNNHKSINSLPPPPPPLWIIEMTSQRPVFNFHIILFC